jgi:hypothetical protein
MPDDDPKRFRYPGKTSIEFADELYIKLANFGAKHMPPLSADRVAEKFCMEGLDRAPHKHVVFEWPPKRETRSKEKP